MPSPLFPSLYQVNTRVWITQLSAKLRRHATLDDIPDAELDRLSGQGFDWIWFLSVWQTGQAAQRISRTNSEWRKEFQETLQDLNEEDIAGSGFAITGYSVHQALGGDAALDRLRRRLQRRGIKLMLDFVPNHMAPDHPWLDSHPEYFVSGTAEDLAKFPQNYVRIKRQETEAIFAYGRDPYFPGWPDTLQLNYGNPSTQEAMIRELLRISEQCDGVRCDMAMLVLPEVFQRTWGIPSGPFWPEATGRVRDSHSEFTFMAEVYWDLEWTLQQQGFDYTYDKRLYDCLKDGQAGPVLGHLHADLNFQNRTARFMENHDEPRAAATFSQEMHEAAAVITYFTPGLRFFHQGQFEGRKKRIPPHLVRAPQEPESALLKLFYDGVLDALKLPVFRTGCWKVLECLPAWEGNDTYRNYIAFSWENSEAESMVIVMNYSHQRSQCRLRLPFAGLANKQWRFDCIFTRAIYDRSGNELLDQGLFLDESGWKYYVFRFRNTPWK